MASFVKNWWDKHDMDRDGKGCALGCMLVVFAVFMLGGSFGAFLIWSIILL